MIAAVMVFAGCKNAVDSPASAPPAVKPPVLSELYPEFRFDGTVLVGYTGDKPTGKLTIPEGVTGIDKHAFYDCDGITEVELPVSLTEIGAEAFSGCTSLTEIGKRAFAYYKGLTGTVVFPASLAVIEDGNDWGDGAFRYCEKLSGVDFSACVNLKEIGENAFFGCEGLTKVELPANLAVIDGNPFFYCPALTEVTVAAGNTAFCAENGIVYNKGKTKLVFAAPGIGSLPTGAFPASLTEIGADAFNSCSSLTGALNLSACTNLKEIGEGAFFSCKGLTGTLDLSGCTKLEKIGKQAFDYCNNLTSAVFAHTDGWAVYDDRECTKRIAVIPKQDLDDPAKAAQYLKDTYRKNYWKRN